jgi:NitT/TauT family transport system ATP-binding protein
MGRMARAATLASKTASDTAAIGSAAPSVGLRGREVTDAEAGRSLLDVQSVTMQYKTQAHLITATYRVSFRVLQGDRFVVVGPSGCGKSTLLKAVGGYLTPTEGEIRLKGERITKPGPDRIMVFQEFDQLLPWMTVFQNVVFPLKTTGTLHGKAADERAMHYIEKVKLTDFAHSYPHTLSGGMKQRVAIARGMAMEPDILLMDEPFAALDALTRTRMQDELLSLWDETRFTVLFVTHSIPEAIKLGSRILLLSPHPGQVKAEINSVPRGQENSNEAAALGREIHDMLFADQIEEVSHVSGG